jgi:hypothetical protein
MGVTRWQFALSIAAATPDKRKHESGLFRLEADSRMKCNL